MNIKELLFSDEATIKLKGCCGTPDDVCDIDLDDIDTEVEFCCSTTIPGNLDLRLRNPRITYSFRDKLRCCLDTCQVECEIADGFSCFANVTLVRIVGCIEYAISAPRVVGDISSPEGRPVQAGCSGTVCVNKLVCIRCSQDEITSQQTLDFCPDFETDDVEVELDPIQTETCNNVTKVTFTGRFILPDGDCPQRPDTDKCECCMTMTGDSGNQSFTGTNPGRKAEFENISICTANNSSDPSASCLDCACGEDIADTSAVEYKVITRRGPDYTMVGDPDTFEVTCDCDKVIVEGQGTIGSNIVDFTLKGIDDYNDKYSMVIEDNGDILHSTDGLIELDSADGEVTVNDCPTSI